MDSETLCPCGSGAAYAACCAPFHRNTAAPQTAEQLMRSRYCAYVLHDIGYIVRTTVPAQQPLLDAEELMRWSRETEWLGLTVLRHVPRIGKSHAQVEFSAAFRNGGGRQEHRELSAFVQTGGRWYFIDPTVPLPTMKQPCICGSDKKFKACCGQFCR